MKLLLFAWLYKTVVNTIMLTCRVKYIGKEVEAQLKREGQPWIYAAWHENTAMTTWFIRNQKVAMMASDSRDGELIASGIRLFGNIPVRGSSSKGGAKAVKAMVKLLKQGHSAAITPDGPRGPVRQLQRGILSIALMSGCPIVAAHIAASREWVFPTWDKHRLPKPFSKVVVSYSATYYVERNKLKQNEAAVMAEVQQLMQHNVERVERELS